MPVLTGTDQLVAAQFAPLRGQRVGLLTNPTGVTNDLRSLIDLLAAADDVTLVALFGPEHGLTASATAGAHVAEMVHPRLGIPIYSLYGAQQAPTAASLAPLDCLLIDLQDVGARFFTYLATVALTLQACGAVGTPVLLLDRPNPLGGTIVEGPIVAPALRSFVGQLPIPIRHGLTLGELARFANAHEQLGADLTVLPMHGWHRTMTFADTALPWVPPSPNMPTPATAAVYPGTCLFEGCTVCEGRGTTLPFQQIGAPWLDGAALAASLNALALPGIRWRPAAFTPYTGGIHVGTPCFGVQLHPTDLAQFRPVTAALHLMAATRAQNPAAFAWREPWAAASARPIELLSGTSQVATAIANGTPIADLVASWQPALAQFQADCQEYLLYQ